MLVPIAWLVLLVITTLAIASGLSRARLKSAPIIARAVLLCAYAAILISSGIWAADCWDCADRRGEHTRRLFFQIVIVVVGLFAVVEYIVVWLAALVSSIIWSEQDPLSARPVVLVPIAMVCAIFGLSVAFSG